MARRRSHAKRAGGWVVGLALAIGWASIAEAQVATVTVKSADALFKQFRKLAGATDSAAAGQMTNGLDALDNGGILKWLARDRPAAATMDLILPEAGAAGPPTPVVAVFLPITSRDDLLDGLKGLGLEIDDKPGVDGFSHKIASGGKALPLYLLADPPTGYAVATNVPSGAKRLRAVKPADLKPTRPGTVLVGLRIDRLPDPIKTAFLTNVRQRNEVSRQRKPGETDEQYKGRLAGINYAADAIEAFVRDGREVTLDAAVDETSNTLKMAMGIEARPGTPMANALGTFGARRGRFLNLWPGAGMTLQGVVPIPAAFRSLMQASIDQQRARLEKDATPEDRRLTALMLDALKPTLNADAHDACIAMGTARGTGKDETNVVLFGIAMKDSIKVEAALRETLAKKLKAEDRDKVALDHDHGPGGTSIHRFTLDAKNLKADEFGQPLMFVAFPEGAAIAAVGGNGLGVLKQAIGSIRKAPGSATSAGPQIGLDVSAIRFSKIHNAENGDNFRAAVREVYPNAETKADPAKAQDHIRIGLSGESGRLRLMLESDLPALNFLAKVGAKRQKAGAVNGR